jgi:aldehyde:ferredoxin oxidoreductase
VPEGDRPPRRWLEPIAEGPLRGEAAVRSWEDFIEGLREFYRVRGYHEQYGVPLPETLRRLGLDWAVDEAERALREVEARLRSGR